MSGSAALNNPIAPGYASRPRLRVMSNGVELPQSLATSITSNNHFQADRFSISFVPVAQGEIGTLQWWSQQTFIPVDIQLGLLPLGAPPNATPSWTSLLTGVSDKISMEPHRNMVGVEGRDLTANFIDNKNTGAYINQSSSGIVSSLAAQYGMTAQAVGTGDLAGRFWNDTTQASVNQSSRVTTEWDLIVSLAKKVGYDAFVQGSTLFFQPQTDPASTPYVWLYNVDQQGRQIGNVIDLKMDRTLTVSKGLEVAVKTWNIKQNKAFIGTASTQASVGDNPSNTKAIKQQYILQHPNMHAADATAYAQQMAAELARHELLISASMPGDTILTPRTMVRLQGTGTAFDQVYYAVSITRNITNGEGFFMHASCKNAASGNAITTG